MSYKIDLDTTERVSVDILSPLLSEGEDPPGLVQSGVSGSIGVARQVLTGVFPRQEDSGLPGRGEGGLEEGPVLWLGLECRVAVPTESEGVSGPGVSHHSVRRSQLQSCEVPQQLRHSSLYLGVLQPVRHSSP